MAKKMIYGLSGPDDRIVYIGTTKNDLKYVTTHHRTSARSALKDATKSSPIRCWVAETGFYSFKAVELEIVEDTDVEDRLTYWMDYCAANGIELLNVTKEQQLARLREVMADPEVRKRMVDNRPKTQGRRPYKKTGRTISEEHKAAVSRAHKGKTVSEETRKKISEKAQGHQRNLGKVHSPEARLKMSHTRHTIYHVDKDIVKDGCRWCGGEVYTQG